MFELFNLNVGVLFCSSDVIEDVQNRLQDIRNPIAAMMVLLRELDLETESDFGGEGPALTGRKRGLPVWNSPQNQTLIALLSIVCPHPCLKVSLQACNCPDLCLAGQSLSYRISLSQLYSSMSAVSVVCQSVCHMATTRAVLCRDLLILQKLYLRCGDNVRSSLKLFIYNQRLIVEILSDGCVCLVLGLPRWRSSTAAAPAGPNPSHLPPALLLPPPQTRQSEPGLLCPCGHHVSGHYST